MNLGSVSNFWMNGRPSGLPENIEDQLAEVKRQQLVEPIENKIDDTQSLKQSFASLDKTLVNLVQASESVSDSDAFTTRVASSSDETVATVQADNQALLGRGNLEVSNLAKAHNVIIGVSDGVSDNGETNGISDPSDEALIGDNKTLSFDHQGESYSYSTTEQPTLNDLAEAINNDENGVQATVSNLGTSDNPSYALLLKSQGTGAGDNQITNITADGLYAGETTEVEEAQAGENASFSLDGVEYIRSSNTVDDVIDGLTIELKDSGSTKISVQKDTQSIVQSISSFVDAYNSARAFIDQSTNYNSEDGTSGALIGSSIANSVDSKMSRTILEPVSGTSEEAYQYLSQVGISFNRQGELELDTAQLQEALANDAESVQKLFVGDNGAAGKLANTLKGYTDDQDGILTYKMESLESKMDRLNSDLDEAEEDVQNYLERLVNQYTAMENAVMKYQSMQDQLESIAKTWTSNKEK